MPLRLNLGSGPNALAGYTNIDRCGYGLIEGNSENGHRVWGGEIYPLPDYADDSADEIRCSHTLEHLPYRDTMNVLREWVRVLKPGGILKIAVPNFEWICRKYLDMIAGGEPANITGYLMGGQTDENDFHKAIFDKAGLTYGMQQAGLVDIQEWTSEVQDCASLPVSLNLMGRKPGGEKIDLMVESARRPVDRYDDPSNRKECPNCKTVEGNTCDLCMGSGWVYNGEQNADQPQVIFDRSKTPIYAVMSTPRLGFMANQFCCLQLTALGIPVESMSGAFWGQSLTNAMLKHLDDGTRYLLTLDYDSVFTLEDVMNLYRIMETRPDIDALAAMQVRRETYTPLVTIADAEGKARGQVMRPELEAETIQVRTAHFGLTLLRVDSLKTLPHPWFQAVPDSEGMWGEGRLDADVSFWHRWYEAGKTLHMANRTVAGHLQLMVSWPDTNMISRAQFLSEYQEQGKPGWVWR